MTTVVNDPEKMSSSCCEVNVGSCSGKYLFPLHVLGRVLHFFHTLAFPMIGRMK